VGVVAAMRTSDGKYRVYLHEDQTAELCEVRGKTNLLVLGRSPLNRVTDWLAEKGYEELEAE
jgi:hypothetical protein